MSSDKRPVVNICVVVWLFTAFSIPSRAEACSLNAISNNNSLSPSSENTRFQGQSSLSRHSFVVLSKWAWFTNDDVRYPDALMRSVTIKWTVAIRPIVANKNLQKTCLLKVKNFKDYRKCIMDAWFIKGAVFVDMYAASTNESYRKRREIKPKRFACIPKTQKFFWLYPLLTRLI